MYIRCTAVAAWVASRTSAGEGDSGLVNEPRHKNDLYMEDEKGGLWCLIGGHKNCTWCERETIRESTYSLGTFYVIPPPWVLRTRDK